MARDNYIEVASAVVLIWRLRKQGDEEEEEQAEQQATLVVGVTCSRPGPLRDL
jgi:hypothetical protein